MRAFAVVAVLLYHGGVSWVNGGLLGVDVFFVLSGFLITSLLCDESVRTGTIALGRFWARRARRLLPALFVLLLGVAAYAHFDAASLNLPSIRGDALATLLYVANWRFILSNQGYFTLAAAPSPLLHTWSLAVEEQYYLIWPLVALPVIRHKGTRGLAWVAGCGALASAVLMLVLYHLGFSIDRLYYGTDTRAQALLVGSFLGAVASKRNWRVFSERWSRTLNGRITGATFGLGGSAFLVWAWHAWDGQEVFLYSGGFLLVALAAGMLIAHTVSWPKSPLSRLCSLAPLTFVGRISYGLYLYHWPLFLALDHAHTGLSGLTLLLVRLSVTFVVAVASYYLIELPVRNGRFLPRRAVMVSGAALTVTVAAIIAATAVPAAGAAPIRTVSIPPGPHVKMILFGDSVAFRVGFALAHSSAQRKDGVNLDLQAHLGCGVLRSQKVLIRNTVAVPSAYCNSGTSTSQQWPALWRQELLQFRPNVTVLLAGRWEVSTQMIDGTWMHIGQPAFDRVLMADLKQAVRVGTSTGALMILETPPCFDSGEQHNGQPWPADSATRLHDYDTMLHQVAASDPTRVTVGNLGALMCPGGKYSEFIDGVRIRTSDGVHVPATAAAGQWLANAIYPEVVRIGRLQKAGGTLAPTAAGHP
jgi:peptidoglycan/LPS O-acetylase OafA/YrhL